MNSPDPSPSTLNWTKNFTFERMVNGFVRKRILSVFKFSKEYPRTTKRIYQLLTVLGLSILFFVLRRMVVIGILILMGALSMYIDGIIRIPFIKFLRKFKYAFELITFGTIMAGVHYGYAAGTFVGFMGAFLGYVISRRITNLAIVVVPGYVILGFVSPLLPSNLVLAAIIGSVIYNAVTTVLTLVILRYSIINCLIFNMINIAFNIFVFSYLGPVFIRFL